MDGDAGDGFDDARHRHDWGEEGLELGEAPEEEREQEQDADADEGRGRGGGGPVYDADAPATASAHDLADWGGEERDAHAERRPVGARPESPGLGSTLSRELRVVLSALFPGVSCRCGRGRRRELLEQHEPSTAPLMELDFTDDLGAAAARKAMGGLEQHELAAFVREAEARAARRRAAAQHGEEEQLRDAGQARAQQRGGEAGSGVRAAPRAPRQWKQQRSPRAGDSPKADSSPGAACGALWNQARAWSRP